MHGTQAGRPLDQTADGVAAARKWAEAAGLTFRLVEEAVGDSHGPAPHPEKDPRARRQAQQRRSFVSVEHRRQAPPRLLICRRCRRPCGQRWGWTAANVLYMLATNGVQDTDLGDNF